MLKLYLTKFLLEFELRIGLQLSNHSFQNSFVRAHFLQSMKTNDLENLRNLRREISQFEKKSLNSSESRNNPRTSYIFRIKQRRIDLLLMTPAFARSFTYTSVSNKNLWYPLHPNWVPIVQRHGYSVSKKISASVYFLLSTFLFFKNLFLSFNMLVSKEKFIDSEFIKNLRGVKDNRTFLVGIGDYSVLQQSDNLHFKNLGNWIKINAKKLDLTDLESDLHVPFGVASLDTLLLEETTVVIKRLNASLGALLSLPRSSFREFVEILSWINFNEIMTNWYLSSSRFLKVIPSHKVIIFNNSQKNNRPIWADQLENLGVRVCLMFYSIEEEPNYLSSGTPPLELWGLASWSEIWFVDSQQQSRFQDLKLTMAPKELIIGYPWWSDSNVKLTKENRSVVTFFSLEPHRSDFTLMPNYSYDFGDPQQAITALKNVLEICQDLGLTLRHKVKRNLSSERFPEYAEAIQSFKLNYSDVYEVIDPKTSVFRMIESSDIVISNPFTTTGMEASLAGKPSIYYVENMEFPDKLSCSGQVELIRDKDRLREWLESEL